MVLILRYLLCKVTALSSLLLWFCHGAVRDNWVAPTTPGPGTPMNSQTMMNSTAVSIYSIFFPFTVQHCLIKSECITVGTTPRVHKQNRGCQLHLVPPSPHPTTPNCSRACDCSFLGVFFLPGHAQVVGLFLGIYVLFCECGFQTTVVSS